MATLPAVKQFSDRVNRIEISATMAVVAEAAKLKAAGADLVEFGAGEPHFSTPQHIKDAAIAAIQQNYTRYTAVAGIPELRSALVKRHAADFGSDYKPEEAIASTGGKLALFNAIQVLVDHGDEVILPVPYWVSFKDIIEYSGGKCVYAETDESEGFRLTAQMIERLITPRTRAIIINSPNNPSGAVLDPEDFTSILQMAHKRGIYVIADECYAYLNYAGENFSAGSVREVKEHLVIAGSLSKTYAMTGWRLGYLVAPREFVRPAEKIQQNFFLAANAFVQQAGVVALTQAGPDVVRMREMYDVRRRYLVPALRDAGLTIDCEPCGAFYVFADARAWGHDSLTLCRRLLEEAGVACAPGVDFGPGGEGFLRFSYATSLDRLHEGVARLKDWAASNAG